MTKPNNFIVNDEDDDFELEIYQEDIDMADIHYFESDDESGTCNPLMESTPMKTNGNNKCQLTESNYDFDMEDSITFEFSQYSMETDKVKMIYHCSI